MKGEGVTSALLASRRHLAAVHQVRDVLEPDRRLEERGVQLLGDPVDQERRREGLRDPAREPPAPEGVKKEQSEHAMRRHERAVLVEHSEPVGVAVLGDCEVEPPGHDFPVSRVQVRPDRLGMDAAEERVALGAERDDACRAGPDDVGDQGPRRAVDRVGENGEPGLADRGQIEERREPLAVRRHEIDARDPTGPGGHGERPVRRPGDLLVELGRRAPAEVRLHLEAVVRRGIVAGRDRDPAGKPEPPDVVGHHGRGDGPVGQKNVDAGAGEDLGGFASQLRREEARRRCGSGRRGRATSSRRRPWRPRPGERRRTYSRRR